MSAATSGMPNYSAIIGQLMGAPPPNANGMFGANPAQAFGQMTNYANQANYQRGQGILSLLSQQGNAAKTQNADIFGQDEAGIDQSMMNKGLSNLTVGDTLKQGDVKNLANADAAVTENTGLNMANMANSFTQKAPDMGLFAQLMQGRGGGGGMSMPAFPMGGQQGARGGSVVQQQIPQMQGGNPNGQIAGMGAMQGNDPNTDMTANPQMTPGSYTYNAQTGQSDDEEAQQGFLDSAGY